MSNAILSHPLGYYRYLRREGYKPRTAWLCCLMRFCTKADFHKRLYRNARIGGLYDSITEV